ncbi:hypothetical protein HID58_047684 [Brassica napus]|uniref:DUF4283 domain-containing protein n=1 Tax=Brassica napus TaxID=3708 RepID=A0ABQ8B1F3_BRANA|nr:hypothetical protein HID58_047684 [Brassica napus]
MKTATTTSLKGPPIQVSANLKQTTNSESAFSKSRSEEITIQQTVQIPSRFTIHPPKSSYPLRTNPASSATIPSSSNCSNPPCLSQNYQSLTLLPCLLGNPKLLFLMLYSKGEQNFTKSVKLEIHLQPQKRPFLVRITNEFTRSKVLAKQLWYVGTSMFYVSEWGSPTASEIPEIVSIPLWAHLSGVSFDLRTNEGLSLAAGLVGEPIETDDYTKNLTDLNVAHVKVEADLTKPLPSSGELLRQNGDIIPISIEYPRTPPSCTHCLCIGHIRNDCIYAPAKDATKVFAQPSQVGVLDPPDSEDLPADPKIDVVPQNKPWNQHY